MLLRCAIFSISLNAVINYDYYVQTDNLPIVGLDPDLKVYGEYFTNSPLPFDSRGQREIITKSLIDNPHPTYPSLLTWQVTYSVEKLSDELLQQSVDNMEVLANDQLAPNSKYGSKRQRYNKIQRKEVKGITLTQDEEDYLDMMDAFADAMEDNADNADNMYDFIELHTGDNEIPDFDSGWTTSI